MTAAELVERVKARSFFLVEKNDSNFCEHCGSGIYWDVVGTDNVATGRSYRDQCDAEEEASLLNYVYCAAIAETLAAISNHAEYRPAIHSLRAMIDDLAAEIREAQ